MLASSALYLLKAGSVEVRTNHTKSLIVSIDRGTIDFDFLDPSPFRTDTRKRIGILDSISEMKGLGKALSDKDITLSVSRKKQASVEDRQEGQANLVPGCYQKQGDTDLEP